MDFARDRFKLRLFAIGAMVVAASVIGSVLLTTSLTTEMVAGDRAIAILIAVIVPLIVAPAAAAAMGVLVLRNHRLLLEVDRLANHDELTGLMNRRAFMRQANDRLAENDGGGRAVLALADLDHFKRVNDSHGHATGDIALRHVAEQLRDSAPEGSLVARLGGEEFAILFEWTSLYDVQFVMKRLCDAVAANPCKVAGEGGQIAITVSIGVAIAGSDEDIDTLLRRADAAMYAAKHNGRNQTKLAA